MPLFNKEETPYTIFYPKRESSLQQTYKTQTDLSPYLGE